ncbi:MAG: EF-P lysine aminoacylase GenX [Proteobacteria bacterium HN_bin10]|nr:MAG: EF-P lysine aminoacylase GenX [Proteobacteria bacterium HN_bin10]
MTGWWDKDRHADRRPFLAARTAIARVVREWFWAQGFTEAEPSMLAVSPGAETHIDAFEVGERYLHTSPEFAMKKLLAAGEEKLFFFGKTWRRGETGPLHAPEFTMIEWYRAGAPYEAIMDDCVEIVRVAARAANASSLRWRDKVCDPFAAAERITVRDAFARHPPSSLVEEGLGEEGRSDMQAPERLRRPPPTAPAPQGGGEKADAFSRDIVRIEPHLGAPALTLLAEYPISEAALAQRCAHDASVAERFELYACGVELANGFGELTDPAEQRARLIAAMDQKQKRYGKSWPIDEDFLGALAHMPPASGVAMGFDRLVMLATGARHINDVLWTPE